MFYFNEIFEAEWSGPVMDLKPVLGVPRLSHRDWWIWTLETRKGRKEGKKKVSEGGREERRKEISE